ncbi:MAG: sulfate transporter CysZ [Methylococcales bacterium]|nr:sulfate transporter CysZ [Methylococcales bacterium]MDP3838426.1 sulfate transporter CysZ [Methylococcales bacterium]
MILLKKANNPLIAVGFLLRGMKLLSHPRLRTFIIIPILINIVLYSVVLALGYYYVDELITQAIPDWLHWLNWILWPLFFISFFVLSFFSFTVLANLIASPFYGLLAARTQSLISGQAQVVEQPLSQVLIAESKRVLYIITRILPLLVLFFIPVINVIASFVLAIFGAWCLAMEYMAYPLENEGLLFAEQKELLKSVRLGALSFGGLTMLGLTLPVLNIIIAPAAVIGATLYLHELREKPEEASSNA